MIFLKLILLNDSLKKEGISTLQQQLKVLDIETYNSIAIDNPHRVIRALEICIGTGQTFSSFKNKDKVSRNFKTITVGLTADRAIIYKRINERVDIAKSTFKCFKYGGLQRIIPLL
jgi:tRNA dimethylallyltransferase